MLNKCVYTQTFLLGMPNLVKLYIIEATGLTTLNTHSPLLKVFDIEKLRPPAGDVGLQFLFKLKYLRTINLS